MFLDKKTDYRNNTFLGVGVILAGAAVIIFASVALILVFALPDIYTTTIYGIVPNEVPRDTLVALIK